MIGSAMIACFLFVCCGESPQDEGEPQSVAKKQSASKEKKDRPKKAKDKKKKKKNGRFRKSRKDDELAHLPPWQRAQQKALQALGYVQGSQEATDRIGVVKHIRAKVSPGLNLYNSGHETSAILMDMEGNTLHRWHYPFDKAFPETQGHKKNEQERFWRRVHLFKNGDLLAIFEGIGMIKIDRHSKLIWRTFFKTHHAVDVRPNGDIFVLTRKSTRLRRIHPTEPVVEDALTIMSSDGQVKTRISIIKAMERFPDHELYWDKTKRNKGDIFHTNSVQVLDGSVADRAPAFAKGNVLLSMAHLNAIFVLDMKKYAITWGYSADFNMQHEPHVLPNKNLILFDNMRYNKRSGHSRVLEYELPNMNVVWSYESTDDHRFYSRTCGAVHRQKNGNTLITETDNGRAFEVTPNKEMVWEFVSPHRAGDKKRLVASLFELKRIPKNYVASWLKK